MAFILFTGCTTPVPPSQPAPPESSQTPTAPAAEYQTITAEQAKAMMAETNDWVLLDVRTDEEFNESHIEGAILIPDFEVPSRIEEEIPDKDALILVYCRTGRRSALAAQEMANMGYTNVYDFGGIVDWPYETISNSHEEGE